MQEQLSSNNWLLGLKATMLLEIEAILKAHLVSLINGIIHHLPRI